MVNIQSERRRRLQAVILAAIIIVAVSFAILFLADVYMLSGMKCPLQFPKWVGCVLANHESLSGSLIGAGGALVAAVIAWRAIMDQIDSDRELARKSERAFVTGGPGARMLKKIGLAHKEIGIVSTGMNTGKTPAFTKEVYWGVCKQSEWDTVGKNWPRVEEARREDWEEVLPPQMAPDDRYPIACTTTPIPDDGENYVCYGGTIVYSEWHEQ